VDIRERILKILTANPETLKKIDDILLGRDKPIPLDLSKETRLLTHTEAARLLNISRPTVHRMAKRGTLDLVSVGGTNRISMRSVIEVSRGMRNEDPKTES